MAKPAGIWAGPYSALQVSGLSGKAGTRKASSVVEILGSGFVNGSSYGKEYRPDAISGIKHSVTRNPLVCLFTGFSGASFSSNEIHRFSGYRFETLWRRCDGTLCPGVDRSAVLKSVDDDFCG